VRIVQQALHLPPRRHVGAYDVVVAAGVEVMSRVAMGYRSQGLRLAFGPSVAARTSRSADLKNQGIGAR